jgi:hypothetical protein
LGEELFDTTKVVPELTDLCTTTPIHRLSAVACSKELEAEETFQKKRWKLQVRDPAQVDKVSKNKSTQA